MPFLKLIPAYLFAAVLLFGAYAHVFSPEAYEAFIPEFVPKVVANPNGSYQRSCHWDCADSPEIQKMGRAWILRADDCLSAASCLGSI